MAEFASKGVATTGLVLGATALGGTALDWAGKLLKGISDNHAANCNDGANRYEMELQQRIAALESGIALRDANIYGDQKLLEVYKYFDGQVKDIRATMCENDKALAVSNAKIEGTFAVLGEQIKAQRNEFLCALTREHDERCCGDNSIVTYANATFYPKMVADVTTGTTTTAQPTYNPVYNCGGCCK